MQLSQSDFLYLTVKQLQATVEDNYFAIQQALLEYTTNPKLELKLGTNLEPMIVEVNHKVQVNLQ